MRRRLLAIYEDVGRRARATIEAHPSWPCRRGCDTCCRRLAEVPRLTRAEWELLREGLDALEPAVRAGIDARIAALAEHRGGDVTCPMLDAQEGACLVYAHRPAACRTYGFYVRRTDALHCGIVEDAVGRMTGDVVWGNQESVDDALSRLSGAELSLIDWFVATSPSPSKPSSEM